MITWLKTLVNGPALDQSKMFYNDRPIGINYVPPFIVSNMSYCAGTSEDIAGEVPFYYALVSFNG